MATFQQIRDRLMTHQESTRRAFTAERPYQVELDNDRHYVWDAELHMQDLNPKIEEWLTEHTNDEYGILNRTIGFKSADHAFEFRMRWA